MKNIIIPLTLIFLAILVSGSEIPVIDVKNQSGTVTTSSPSIPIIDINNTARVISGGAGGGGNISGSGVAERVAVFDNSTTVRGYEGLQYNPTTTNLTVIDTIILSDGDNDGSVFLKRIGSLLRIGATAASEIELVADETDIIGTISATAFSGNWLPAGNGQSLGSPTQRLLDGWFSGSVNTTEVNATKIKSRDINTTGLNASTIMISRKGLNTDGSPTLAFESHSFGQEFPHGIATISGEDALGVYILTTEVFRINSNSIDFGSAIFRLGSAVGSSDVAFSRKSANTLQLGSVSEEKDQVLAVADNQGGTNRRGNNLTLQAGAGTGNSTIGGDFRIETPTPRASGSLDQVQELRFLIDHANTTILNNLTTQNIRSVNNLTARNVHATGNITASNFQGGVYFPIVINTANLDSSSVFDLGWVRTMDTMTIYGKVHVDPTLTATSTRLSIYPPISSNFQLVEDCGGAAFSPFIAGQGAAMLANVTNNTIQMQWVSSDITNQPMHFSVSCLIR